MTGSNDVLLDVIQATDTRTFVGRIVDAVGTQVRVSGIPARIGEQLCLRDPLSGKSVLAEVVGIQGAQAIVAPFGSLAGVGAGMEVHCLPGAEQVKAGTALLGRVLDAWGAPLDGLPEPECTDSFPLHGCVPPPMERQQVITPLVTGIRVIDGLLTLGYGQRVGIFASAGVGKSSLLGMLARGADVDVIVVVLVGERGREVSEFITDNLGEAGLRKCVVLVATSDRPALERCRVAEAGTAIAGYFRDQGLRVLLLMDSVTRYARALRDVGLAAGELPVRRGFTPSVFERLPQLFERAGSNAKGFVTAIYTVLVEDEQEGEDPVAEEVRSLLDGHILLSRQLAASAHYPAVDVLRSASRIMHRMVSAEHRALAASTRQLLARYQEVELLLQVGEYKPGVDADTDRAIATHQPLRQWLRQDLQADTFDQTIRKWKGILR